ncbi:15931_t:CDS:2 [Cetraspora pellucida]|uniref:15931_t:CDS:1 n=1 Tax=Cetraspora pellucida TaxID=1433469 RepID=A0A9N9FKS6_9GLOM|nr:15931_t:CDS:2 [Cetraspora pellucida]
MKDIYELIQSPPLQPPSQSFGSTTRAEPFISRLSLIRKRSMIQVLCCSDELSNSCIQLVN